MLKGNYTVTVTNVIDGDTFDGTVSIFVPEFDVTLTKSFRFRMIEINAPEMKGVEKPLGEKSKAWLKQRIEGKTLTVETKGTDKYSRILGVVFDSSGASINNEMVNAGFAEIYKGRVGDYGKAGE